MSWETGLLDGLCFGVLGDPFIGMSADLVDLVLAFLLPKIGSIYVVDRDFKQLEKLHRSGIGFGKFLVGQHPDRVGLKLEVTAIGRCSIYFGLVAGPRTKRYVEPDGLLPGAQKRAYPKRGPRVLKDRVTGVALGHCVGYQREVFALVVSDRFAKLESVELMLNDRFAPPAGIAPAKIGFAVAIGVEKHCKLGVAQLSEVGYSVLVCCRLVDQVTLCRALNMLPQVTACLNSHNCFV